MQRFPSLAVVRPLKRRWQEVTALVNARPGVFPGNHQALKALDGDLRTRWTPEHPQQQGDAFLLDLGEEVRVDYVQVLSGEFSSDYPRGLRIDVSREGKQWEPVPVRPVPQRLYFINGELIANHHGENNPIYDLRSVQGPFRYLEVHSYPVGPDLVVVDRRGKALSECRGNGDLRFPWFLKIIS